MYRMQNLYKIKNKKHEVTNLRFNNAQQRIINSIQDQQPIRNIVIKSRQEGVSTFWLLWWLDDTLFHKNITTGILSHKWESLNHLWGIITFAYKNLPDNLKAPLGEDSKRALYFKEIESKIFISLSIQSVGVHNLHISEWCWCNDEEVKITLGSISPYTNVSGESTGNGVSNDGYATYQDAKLEENEYTHQFLPWFIQEEYRLPLQDTPEANILNDLKPEERRLKQVMKDDYALNLEGGQVLWRRQAIKRLKDLFPQEYPETDEDAFITSGMHYFNVKKVMTLLNEVRLYRKKIGFYEEDDRYTCFEQPQQRDVYVAAADTAEGGADYCVLKIINVTQRREAFVYRARCGVKAFYKACDHWCRIYNNALFAVENNFPGNAVILGLEEDCHYNNLYKEIANTRVISKMSDKPKIKTGWQTNVATRKLMIAELKYFIEDDNDVDVDNFAPEYEIYDEILLREMLTFINKDGKYEAEEGKNDDDVIASAIATQMYKTARPKTVRREVLTGSTYAFGKEYDTAKDW